MDKKKIGVLAGLSSYIWWGLLSIFWHFLSEVPAFDMLAYRMVWSLVTMLVILSVQKSWGEFFQLTKMLIHSGKIVWIGLCAIFISINWLVYIYMVTHQQAMLASLGYYILPLFNVMIALVFLKEKLLREQWLAVSLATIGVIILTIQTGTLPINTLLMAGSFGMYGLIKRKVPLPATISLTLETIFVFPFAVIYLLLFTNHSLVEYSIQTNIFLLCSGVVTAVPLILFALAAKYADFITLSFIQYINPTIQLLIAVSIFHEPFSMSNVLVFVFIWAGIAVYAFGSVVRKRKKLYE
uniref:EamA family transporter RarD n=1 Tax=Candidatus Enterococcus willemsii TaxID=1857215 RepID=UPI00403F20F4